MIPQDLFASPKPYTRTTFDDKVALLGSTATSTGAVLLGPSGGPGVTTAFAGSEVTAKTNGKRILPRTITLTTSTHAGSYKTGAGNPWTVSGTVNGVPTTEPLLLTQANGNETIRGVQLWDDPTQVTIANAGQNDALGAVTVGLGDIGAPKNRDGSGSLRGFKPHATGSVVVMGDDGKYDTQVIVNAGLAEPVNAARICVTGGGDTTTTMGITVYP